jgi:virulence factor Mce-like protein
MGIDVGTVDSVELEDTYVRVEMTIDDDVPLPDDVEATIEPLQLIGERNVVLFPAWNEAMAEEGKGRAGDGDVIAIERTHTPVEPDEGLEAFNGLARSLDPETVGQLIDDSAEVLDGQGANLGAAIDQAATLTELFARTDDNVVAAAEALHRLAASVNTRDEQLAAVVRSFSGASEVLASERDGITAFLSALVELTRQGSELLDTYGGTLPTDIANVAALASIFHQNQDDIDSLVETLPRITDGINRAYDPTIDGLRLRASATPTLVALIDAFADILGVLGLG